MPKDRDRRNAENQDDKNVSTATAAIDNPDEKTQEQKDAGEKEHQAILERLKYRPRISDEVKKDLRAAMRFGDKLEDLIDLGEDEPLVQQQDPKPDQYFLPPPDQAKNQVAATGQSGEPIDEKKPVEHGEKAWS